MSSGKAAREDRRRKAAQIVEEHGVPRSIPKAAELPGSAQSVAAIQRFRRLGRLFAITGGSVLEGRNIRESDLLALYVIERSEEEGVLVRGVDLQYALMNTSSSIAKRLSRLTEEGLIVRTLDPNDRRALSIHITPKGKALTRRARAERANGQHGRLGDELSAEDWIALNTHLDKIIEYLEKIRCQTTKPKKA